jgi:2-polyprenyl-6-methoxyphenol hydroxylase-like FAD-dependent oxidoreductase
MPIILRKVSYKYKTKKLIRIIMTSIVRKAYLSDYLLVATALANNEIEKNTLEAAKRLRGVVDHLPPAKMLCNVVNFRITAAALNCGLYFRALKPLAVINGAGIAGLAVSFELRARGFNVVIAEKRKSFSRFNVINLNVETQAFLKRFNLLEKFERFVAARIKEHRYVLVEKSKSTGRLALSDVSGLRLDESVSFEPGNFNKLFEQDGIYSVPIGVLQTFLAENALETGVNIFGDVTIRILSRTQTGGVSKVQITFDRTLQPDLFFIAEGAHSTTAHELDMRTRKVTNACTGENWVFGNMTYSGKETFVVSLIDASEKTLRIANVIFNAKSQVINIAVTSDKEVPEDMIREQILRTAHQVFAQRAFPLEEMHSALLTTVSKPVNVTNRTSFPFSRGNVFCIGDSAGSSSPLAGLGGTLGLTLVPLTVRKLLDDYERQSRGMHRNFNEFSEGYTSRWIQKSEGIKRFCISIFDKQHSAS